MPGKAIDHTPRTAGRPARRLSERPGTGRSADRPADPMTPRSAGPGFAGAQSPTGIASVFSWKYARGGERDDPLCWLLLLASRRPLVPGSGPGAAPYTRSAGCCCPRRPGPPSIPCPLMAGVSPSLMQVRSCRRGQSYVWSGRPNKSRFLAPRGTSYLNGQRSRVLAVLTRQRAFGTATGELPLHGRASRALRAGTCT